MTRVIKKYFYIHVILLLLTIISTYLFLGCSEAKTPNFTGNPPQDIKHIKKYFASHNLHKVRFVWSDNNIWWIKINDTEVSDISLLEGFKIEALDLSGTQVSNLNIVSGLKELRKLNLDNTPIMDLSPISCLEIEELSLNNTGVTNLEPLAKLPLKVLSIKNIPVTDFSFVPVKNLLSINFTVQTQKRIVRIEKLKYGRPNIVINGFGNSDDFWKSYNLIKEKQ